MDLLKKFLIKNRKNIVQLAQQLIRISSVNGNETEVANKIASILRAHGIKSRLMGNDKKRLSLIASIGKGERAFMLNAHLDTVSAGSLLDWKYPPFAGKLVGGKLYGRGSYDLKGSLASATYAFIAVKKLFPRLSGKIILAFNSDEESGYHTGIKYLLNHGLHADAAICCEPRYGDSISIGAKGIYRFELISLGTAGHTGYPNGAINSVTKMAKLLLALEKLTLTHDKHPLFSKPHITPGTVISAGTAINIFPQKCSALVDCRLVLGQSLKDVKSEILKCLKAVKSKDSKIQFELREIGFVPAALTEASHPFVKLSQRIISKVCGLNPNTIAMNGVTDGNFLIDRGIPTVIYGPTGGNAHAANEFVNVQSLFETAECYAMTAIEFLNLDQG